MRASRGLVGGIYSPHGAVPTVTVYCLPLAFATHARYYRDGARTDLVIKPRGSRSRVSWIEATRTASAEPPSALVVSRLHGVVVADQTSNHGSARTRGCSSIGREQRQTR